MADLDAAGVAKLTQDTFQALKDLVIGVMTILERRALKRPVAQVSDLFFAPDGMRVPLERIACGNATDADFASLKRKLGTTEKDVSDIIKTLDAGWKNLIRNPDGLEIANEIGEVIHSPIGKMGIRYSIAQIIQAGPKHPQVASMAQRACKDIDQFNRRLIDLHNRVIKPAAEILKG